MAIVVHAFDRLTVLKIGVQTHTLYSHSYFQPSKADFQLLSISYLRYLSNDQASCGQIRQHFATASMLETSLKRKQKHATAHLSACECIVDTLERVLHDRL
jgi:hypothetical protein